MPVFDLNKVAQAGLVALVLGGSTLVSTAAAVAADLPPYFEDQGAVLERPPARLGSRSRRRISPHRSSTGSLSAA